MNQKEPSDENAQSLLRGEKAQGQYHVDTQSESNFVEKSSTPENQSIRSDRALASGTERKLRVKRLGGIRSQLKQLQADHLAYVEAHGQRLEARLQENRKHKSKVLADIEVLQKELDDLIAEAEAEAEEE